MTDRKENFEFKVKQDNWDTNIERSEMHFLVNEIKKDKRVPMLRPKVGVKTYKLIRELCSPTEPGDGNYKEIVGFMKNHLNPAKNEAMERYKFQNARQRPKESVTEFIARLKELAIHCTFNDLGTAM